MRGGGSLLLAVAALLAACGGGGESGPEGSVDDYCRDYAYRKTTVYDPSKGELIPGILTLGLAPGMKPQEAAAFLKTLGTSYYMPLPYQEFAVLCVKEGYEEQWVEIAKTHDKVEWAHREGVRRLDAAADEQ